MMFITKELQQSMSSVYEPDLTAKDLAATAGCQIWEAHLYLAQRLYADNAFQLSEKGLSLRQIAAELGTSHQSIFRWKKRREQEQGSE